MEPQHPDTFPQLGVPGRDEAAVAEGEQVLRRVEAERRGDARACDLGRPERLGGILDQRHPELHKLRDRCRPAEQVHRDGRLRARSDARGDVLRIEVHRRGVDIREHRRRSTARDRLGGRVERERRADDLVARADAQCVEDEHERVGAVGDADRVPHAEIGRRLSLEGGHVGPEDEVAALEHAVDHLADAGQKRVVLCSYVNEWDRTHGRQV